MKIGWVSRYDTSMIQCPCFFPGSAAGTAALKDMRCKFDVSLYQSWTFEVSVYIKLTLTLNLHIKSVSLQCTSNLHVNSVSLV